MAKTHWHVEVIGSDLRVIAPRQFAMNLPAGRALAQALLEEVEHLLILTGQAYEWGPWLPWGTDRYRGLYGPHKSILASVRLERCHGPCLRGAIIVDAVPGVTAVSA